MDFFFVKRYTSYTDLAQVCVIDDDVIAEVEYLVGLPAIFPAQPVVTFDT